MLDDLTWCSIKLDTRGRAVARPRPDLRAVAMKETNTEPGTEGEDEGVLTVFYWYDDEPADDDELWAALYDGEDD